MVRKGQRTGVFDLHDVDAIQLNPPTIQAQQHEKNTIGNPKIFVEATELKANNGKIPIEKALVIVKEQMKIYGIRPVTGQEYIYIMKRFADEMDLVYLDEITMDVAFEWLSKLGDVSNVTKQSKLRVLKAVLNRFYDNGWFERNWWKPLKIKIDEQIKPPADEQQLSILLSLLDMSDFIQFRDAVAILTMYKCGLRVATLIQLEEKHIDFETYKLNLTGDIMKNHDVLKLPIDEELAAYLKRLIQQNNVICKHYKKRNKLIFIGKFGDTLDIGTRPSAITKRLSYYAKKYGLTNINAHAIRRLYAHNLRKKGVDVVLISKALSHKSLAVTTRYLGITSDEVVKSLRDYL